LRERIFCEKVKVTTDCIRFRNYRGHVVHVVITTASVYLEEANAVNIAVFGNM